MEQVDRKEQMIRHLVMAALVVSVTAMVFAWSRKEKARLNAHEVVATIAIFDPKTGREKIFGVHKFEVMEPSYTRFITADGRTVEIVENEVKVK